ncbi:MULTISPECIES: peptide-methionine (S)-S-oxide reductase MsrA [Halomicrobium]|uniref:Peptide methionine sulfoxide reductase MsrA n=2 Tax=Halomicrobium mukohataei TaxID=57705 RepID=C7NWI6_HALMD|nr:MULTISPECIES: peptide-methionine (S)-S-oxide reductase MsrA [Halomicrobium]ACV46327.1 peptide methionine sulfoxide reductase [Halomicrobium mukohataei DSM 12286]QCD64883.1 peptide-methionine (S)-S-oxide reductase MsrA [Halomicrobium mukohataei]QFR19689.1 peptide-methionine (S)-S-oxide reductase MsrA [Halomicrobium sp. ZPS1]
MSEPQTATVAGGCFWCTEAVFKQIEGVESITSGYAGGHVADPSYDAVCSGETGHAECVQVEYDPDVIDYGDVLTVFFATHDPTTKNRQGPDVGSQYRSAVFYHDEAQRETVEAMIDDLGDQYSDPIVTEVEPLETFYPAEQYHQDYYERNPDQGYCAVNIDPKLEKLNEQFRELLA